MESVLPVDLWHWLLALSPLALLLVLLAVLGWKAPQAGPVGLFFTAALAMLFFRTPLDALAAAVGTGVWDAIFVLFVVWPALLLYRVTDAAGGFTALRDGIRRFSRNQLFLVLAFGWVFASFLQGITGFGTPIAVVAPLLVAIGVKPVYAVVIPLIGHAWANVFGTLAVAWLATLQVVELENPTATAIRSAILLWIPNALAGVAIAWMFGRVKAVVYALPFVAIVTTIHGGGQLALVLFDPILSAFIATTVALLALYPLSKWPRYSDPVDHIEHRPAMREDAGEGAAEERPEARMSFAWSLVPYAVLTVAAVAVLAVEPIETALSRLEVGLPFGETSTGYDVTNEPDDPYSPFAPITHPGAFLLLAAGVSYLLYRSRGFYGSWGDKVGRQPIWKNTAGDAVPASIAIVAFLALAKVMDYSGQVDVLAVGIANVAPAVVYAFAANFIGLIGSFMTSSNTASNVLLGGLQEGVAEGEAGLTEAQVIAAQNAGAAIGNSISPANAVLGTTTAGIVGQEGAVLRRTLPWAGAAAVLVGAATLFM